MDISGNGIIKKEGTNMKRIKFNSLEEFSVKDVISIVLITLFIASVSFVIYGYFSSKDMMLLELLKVEVPIIIAILSIYGGSELTSSIIPKLQQGKQIIEAANDLIPTKQTEQTIISKTEQPDNSDSLGGI